MMPTAYDLATTAPHANSTQSLMDSPERVESLNRAMNEQVRRNTLGSKQGPVKFPPTAPILNTPESRISGMKELLAGSPKYASNVQTDTGSQNRISINPNVDSAYFMHEVGHTTSREGKLGGLVRAARDNPMLIKALNSARFIAPLSISALTPGDDDMAESIIASYLSSAPTIFDEGLATKNALSMMKTMGQSATMGQRARLAGSFLSYLGAPLIAGVSTNFAGNLMDDEIAQRIY
jgi:hypothetical protein